MEINPGDIFTPRVMLSTEITYFITIDRRNEYTWSVFCPDNSRMYILKDKYIKAYLEKV